MILGFKQTFPWNTKKNPAPTYFREKILAGAGFGPIVSMPKIHTIREDIFDRWKPGMSIEMVYRGPNYSILHHFNKGISALETCVSCQSIEIKWTELDDDSFVNKPVKIMIVKVDGKTIEGSRINLLSLNDGFQDASEFAMWFKKDFTGKIIHWTDYKY